MTHHSSGGRARKSVPSPSGGDLTTSAGVVGSSEPALDRLQEARFKRNGRGYCPTLLADSQATPMGHTAGLASRTARPNTEGVHAYSRARIHLRRLDKRLPNLQLLDS